MNKTYVINNKLCFAPEVDISVSHAHKLKDEFLKEIKKNSLDTILDLARVKMIDSVGIGLIISLYRSVNETGKEFKIINVKEEFATMFKTMNLNRHFEILL